MREVKRGIVSVGHGFLPFLDLELSFHLSGQTLDRILPMYSVSGRLFQDEKSFWTDVRII